MASTAPRPDWRSDPPALPDEPIDFSVPYRTREKGASRHFGFFPFFAKKPWPVVQEYIKHYSSPGDLVCDPFAGSGVTPVEGLVLGRRAVASDINPVARFITRMTAAAPIDLQALTDAFEGIRLATEDRLNAVEAMTDEQVIGLLRSLDTPRTPLPASVRRAHQSTVADLHTPRQLASLTILRDAIRQVAEPIRRDLLRVALANAVRYANVTYDLPYDGDKRRSVFRGNANFLRRFSFSPAKQFYEHAAWPAFERGFKGVLEAKAETNVLIGHRFETDLVLADVSAASIHQVTGEGQVDYCFTDPPYANDIFFLDLSVLWASWLDLEITPAARRAELIVGGETAKTTAQFLLEFQASVESIARSLKPDAWFTLSYKHKDLRLWQSIVHACEESGLRYVNGTWQDVVIPSTRQIEKPHVNPRGDMYLNFRRMPQKRFEAVYPQARVLDLPTRANYIEHEIERIIVSYLGADVERITYSVLQQLLDSRSFREYRENPTELAKSLQDVLMTSKRFLRWQVPSSAKALWIMAADEVLDASIDAVDRMRYYAFEMLRSRGEATQGEIHRALLTQLASEPHHPVASIDLPALLRSFAEETPERWVFRPEKVSDFTQLRLLFGRSRVDEIRERMEQLATHSSEPPLRADLDAIALLRDRLLERNPQGSAQVKRLLEVLQQVVSRLEGNESFSIERVQAIGEWATEGFDLRDLRHTELALDIVLRGTARDYRLYDQLAERVFGDLPSSGLFFQFTLTTLPEWRRAEAVARQRGEGESQEDILGVPLLRRAW